MGKILQNQLHLFGRNAIMAGIVWINWAIMPISGGDSGESQA
jgi:hypothetical protein